jgi:hypothetical protein
MRKQGNLLAIFITHPGKMYRPLLPAGLYILGEGQYSRPQIFHEYANVGRNG